MSFSALKNAVLSEKIDWIAYSQAYKLEWGFPDYIDTHWKKISPLRNYTNGEENKQGVKRFWNVENVHQGRYVVLSGHASAMLGENQRQFLHGVHTSGKKMTRIDFALDITHSKLKAQTANKHLKAGDVITHAQSAIVDYDEFKGGFTQYVGKKSSETYTRIYDKSKEQKTDYSWVRIETVYQGARATPALQTYLQCESTRPLIKRHVDFPGWTDFQTVMQGDIVQLYVPPKETDTRHWLLTQVAKSVAGELFRDEDHQFWFVFQDAIKQELDKLSKNEVSYYF